jgi:hypothetical protein
MKEPMCLSNFMYNLKRIYFELALFILNGLALFGFHDLIENPALQLISFKMLLINAGLLHGHMARKLIFPYIDFGKEQDTVRKVMIVAVYVIIIFAYASGG